MAQAQKTGGGGGSLYFEIANFQTGIDVRKSDLTAPAGSLRTLTNAHLTQGGEIEKREAFQLWGTAPAGSLGLVAVDTIVYTHQPGGTAGDITPPSGTPPSNVPGVIHIGTGVHASVDVDAWIAPVSTLDVTSITGGIPIAVGQTITGTDVASGTKIFGRLSGSGGTGTYFVTPQQTASAPDTTSGGATITGSISGADTVMRVISVGSSIIAGGTKIYGTGVSANSQVTGNGSGSGGMGTYYVSPSQTSYPSSIDGGLIAGVTLVAQIDWDVYNGKVYAVFQGSDGQYYHFYGGVQVVQATNHGSNIRTYKEKMYGVQGRNLYFSAVGDPTIWENPSPDTDGNVEANGSGFINIGSQDSDSEDLLSMEVYYDKMALFSRLACQLWFLDPDPSLNQYYQTLRDAGTISPNSVRQYVANDIYFLGSHGIRSLRARDLTLTASVADVGSPIDPLVIAKVAAKHGTGYFNAIQTLLSSRTGRIWMIAEDQILVLSNFASPNISAWSVYVPEFTPTAQGSLFADPYVFLRASDDKIYVYGGQSPVYDSCPVEFITSFLSFDKPVSYKFYEGFDAICANDPGSLWNIEVSFDPTVSPVPYDQICTTDGPTVLGGRIPVSGRSTHIKVRVTHAAPGPATFAKLFVHYAPSDTG